MSEHTPEPWECTQFGIRQKGIKDSYITRGGEKIVDADRIVACVNACAGMSDPAAEIDALRASLRDMTRYASDYLLCQEAAMDDMEETYLEKFRTDLAKARELINKETL